MPSTSTPAAHSAFCAVLQPFCLSGTHLHTHTREHTHTNWLHRHEENVVLFIEGKREGFIYLVFLFFLHRGQRLRPACWINENSDSML